MLLIYMVDVVTSRGLHGVGTITVEHPRNAQS